MRSQLQSAGCGVMSAQMRRPVGQRSSDGSEPVKTPLDDVLSGMTAAVANAAVIITRQLL